METHDQWLQLACALACSREDSIVAAQPTEHHATAPAVVLAIQHGECNSTAWAVEHLDMGRKDNKTWLECHVARHWLSLSLSLIATISFHWPSSTPTGHHLHGCTALTSCQNVSKLTLLARSHMNVHALPSPPLLSPPHSPTFPAAHSLL